MNKYLKLEDTFDCGRHEGKTVREVIEKDRKKIVSLSKEGYYFDDEVLRFARYTRTIRDERIILEFVDKKVIKDNKKYAKDSTEKAKKFIRDLSVLENDKYNFDKEDDTVNIENYN